MKCYSFVCQAISFFFGDFSLPRIFFISFLVLCLGYFSFSCLGYFHFIAWDIFILLPRIYFIPLLALFHSLA